MIDIFESGYFRNFGINDSAINDIVNESRSFSRGEISTYKTTVFLSHKHSDLEEVKEIIGFLRSRYNIDIYIDSEDSAMPDRTSPETATRIKAIIDKCDRFILLATDDAIESKWCNWELGYGDAKKYKDKIAILPIKKKRGSNLLYKGSEYLNIYPYISKYLGHEKYTDNTLVKADYYVVTRNANSSRTITSLSKWFKK